MYVITQHNITPTFTITFTSPHNTTFTMFDHVIYIITFTSTTSEIYYMLYQSTTWKTCQIFMYLIPNSISALINYIRDMIVTEVLIFNEKQRL